MASLTVCMGLWLVCSWADDERRRCGWLVPGLAASAFVALAGGTALALTTSSSALEGLEIQRIWYVRLPAGALAGAAWMLAALSSVVVLMSGQAEHDAIAEPAVEVGFVLASIHLAMGMLLSMAADAQPWHFERHGSPTGMSLAACAAYFVLRALLRRIPSRPRGSACALLFLSAAILAGVFVRKWFAGFGTDIVVPDLSSDAAFQLTFAGLLLATMLFLIVRLRAQSIGQRVTHA